MTISYRLATSSDADRQFIVSAWSSSFKASHSAGMIYTDDWPEVMHKQIKRVLDRPDTRVMLAYENTEPDFFYGFIAGDTSAPVPSVWYCYVKAPYRNMGYARGLFAALGVDPSKPFTYACKTAIVSKLSPKIPLAKWNPLAVRFPKEQAKEQPWKR